MDAVEPAFDIRRSARPRLEGTDALFDSLVVDRGERLSV
jgi:hypothetical protein